MKANELMVGDWVRMPLGLPEIRQVKYPSEIDDADFYEPISLTAEILEKNGFTIHLSHCGIKWLWIEKQKFELAIDEENRNKITTALGLIDIEIKYVHELQHALRLCGIDKEIKL